MAKYSQELNKGTTSTTVGVASLEAPGSGMRRIRLGELVVGSEATPADNVFAFRLTRSSTANTGSAVTPSPLDPADAAAASLLKENLTVEGTLGVVLFAWPLNARATFRWVASPASEFVIAATAAAGIILQTPTALNTPACTAGVIFQEE